PRLGITPVGALGQPLVQPAPELNAGGHRWRRLDRAQARDVLVANPAVLPAVLNQAHCQPIGRLAKVHEHCSGTIRARFLPSEAGAFFGGPRRSFASAGPFVPPSGPARTDGRSRPSALAVLRLITNSYLVGACTGRSAGFSPLRMRST